MHPNFNMIILIFLTITITGFKNNPKSIEKDIVKNKCIYQEDLEPKNLVGKWIMDGEIQKHI